MKLLLRSPYREGINCVKTRKHMSYLFLLYYVSLCSSPPPETNQKPTSEIKVIILADRYIIKSNCI